MKTKTKSLVRNMALSATLFGVTLFGGTIVANKVPSSPFQFHTEITASAHANTNAYWAGRINRFARRRAKYYHPDIGYNFRDIGGLPSGNGKYIIKPGHLFRSDNIHYISANGANDLKRLHVNSDIDLRYHRGSGRSVHNYPDPGEMGSQNKYGLRIHYMISPVQSFREERNPRNERLYKRYGENYDFSHTYVLPKIARASYHKDLVYIANNYHRNSATMANCTQGRDRTGVLNIILEHILGVRTHNIYNDFLLTNHYKYQTPYTEQLQRINGFYRSVHQHYGSLDRYISRGLYLPNKTIKRLRYYYLERIPKAKTTRKKASRAPRTKRARRTAITRRYDYMIHHMFRNRRNGRIYVQLPNHKFITKARYVRRAIDALK